MLTNSELRRMARESLQGNWVNAVLGVFIYGVILSALSYIPFIGWIGTIVLTGPLTFGLVVDYGSQFSFAGLLCGENEWTQDIGFMCSGFNAATTATFWVMPWFI